MFYNFIMLKILIQPCSKTPGLIMLFYQFYSVLVHSKFLFHTAHTVLQCKDNRHTVKKIMYRIQITTLMTFAKWFMHL